MEMPEPAAITAETAVGNDDGAAASGYILWCALIVTAGFFPYTRAWGINLLAFSSNTIRIVFAALAICGLLVVRRPNWFDSFGPILQRIAALFNGRRGAIILTVLVGLLATILASREAFLGDGTLRAEDALKGATILPSEIAASGLAALLARNLPSAWGIDGYWALRIVSIAFAVLMVVGLWWLAPKVSESGRRSVIFWILTFGSVRMLAGYMETYMPAIAAFVLTTFAGVAYRRRQVSVTTVILLWIAAMLSHVTAVLLVPMILWALMRQPDGSLRLNAKGVLAFGIVVLVIGGGVISAFYLFQVDLAGATTGHFLVPLFAAPPLGYGLFSWSHLLDFGNELLLLAPAFLVGLAAYLFGRRRARGTGHDSSPGQWWYADPRTFWILATALPIGAGFLIDPKLGMARDWDLYAVMFSPALVGAAIWLDRQSQAIRRAAAVVAVASATLWLSYSVDAHAERVRFETLLDLDAPRSDYGHEIMAQYYRRLGDYENAIRHYRMSLAVSENLRYRLNIAAGYYHMKKYDDAERWYRGVIARDSTSAEAYHGLSLVLSDMRKQTDALDCAQRALSLAPSNVDYAYRVGSALLELEQYATALPYLELTARALPIQAYRLNSLAVCYLELDRLSEASAAIDGAARLDPNEPVIWLNSARIAMRSGDTRSARRYLTEYENRTSPAERHPEARLLSDSLARMPGGL
jgi:tetratricopeptide (TPR) repeat protein